MEEMTFKKGWKGAGQLGHGKIMIREWDERIGKKKKIKKQRDKERATAPNRTVCVPLPLVASGFHSPRSLRSHGLFHPQFVGPGLCYAKPLSGPPNRRIQPERYAKWGLKFSQIV
jgi:hypothetical protein